MRCRHRSGAVVLAAGFLLAGCGGSSPSHGPASFKSGFGSVVNQFQRISHSIGVEIQQAPSQSDAKIGTTFRRFAAEWQAQVTRLKTLRPAANVAGAFSTLTGAASHVESDLNSVVSAADAHSESAATRAARSLIRDILAAKSAATTITGKLGIK
jgi:hypothetical protein